MGEDMSFSYGASDVADAASGLVAQIADGKAKRNQYLALIEQAKANRVKAASARAQAEWDKVIEYRQAQADYYQNIIDCYTQMINNNGTAASAIIEQQAQAQAEQEAKQKKKKIIIFSVVGLAAIGAVAAVVYLNKKSKKEDGK